MFFLDFNVTKSFFTSEKTICFMPQQQPGEQGWFCFGIILGAVDVESSL